MPPHISALDALLYRDWEMEVWRSYEAGVMRLIAQGLGAKKLPVYEECIKNDEGTPMTEEAVKEQRKRLLDGLRAG